MRIASIEVIHSDIIQKCSTLGIDIYPLHNSQKHVLAFLSNNHRRREFEVYFMSDNSYRICTRYLGYVSVMKESGFPVVMSNDPDGRRKRFSLTVDATVALNTIINEMLTSGFSETPHIELI